MKKISILILVCLAIFLTSYFFLQDDEKNKNELSNVIETENKISENTETIQSEKNTMTQEKNITPAKLTLEAIYKDKAFDEKKMDSIRWLKDGSGYTVLEENKESVFKNNNNEEGSGEKRKKVQDIVAYDPKTLDKKVLISASELIPAGQKTPLAIDDYIWSDDRAKILIYTNSKKVWRTNTRGDYWSFDIKSRELQMIGAQHAGKSKLMFAKFSPDAEQVAYVYENNIYVQSLASKKIQQLTFDADEHLINGLFDWVYEEEFAIADGFRWSPDSKKIAYWQLDTKGSQDFIMINNTDDIYPTLTRFPYPKVGEVNSAAKIGVVNLSDLKTTWMSLPGNPRNRYIPRMDWAGNSEQIAIQQMNRKQDRNWLYLTDIKTGNSYLTLTEEEETFIEGVEDIRWVNNAKSFLWVSERDGWRHLYRVSRDGKNMVNLTPGEYDLINIELVDDKNNQVYFIASPDNVAQRYLYRAEINFIPGENKLSSVTRITPVESSGTNQYQISPDGQWAIHSHSSFHQPTNKSLISLADHKAQHQMLNNNELKQKITHFDQTPTEFFQVKARDGLLLDGYMMKPNDFDASKKYPVIFFVYGWPYGQTVKDVWQGEKFFWHKLMTEKGFIIISIDNRGTGAPKGSEWRKSIYGGVGIISSQDQFDALQVISEKWSYIDNSRVGVWGHSGGGSMTLDLLFRYPDSYHVGVSIAPVTDQKLYDTIYQERYSGLLEDHAEGYKQGSAITHAHNLKGKLLLVHGTGDDNVHYQHSEMLINELVKHNKPFDFMSYPNRSHSVTEGEGTSLHLRSMMANYFVEHLLNK